MNERIDPPEPVEASYDVYITVMIQVQARSEADAITEAAGLIKYDGDAVDAYAELSCACCPDPDDKGDAIRNGDRDV